MTWEAWAFSAKRAWLNPFVRWTTVATALLLIVGTTFFFWRTLSRPRQNGSVILHYNVYLGIDEIGAWPWAFLLPGVWLAATALDLAFAYGSYRADPHLAVSLVASAALLAIPWAVALYYLSVVNV